MKKKIVAAVGAAVIAVALAGCGSSNDPYDALCNDAGYNSAPEKIGDDAIAPAAFVVPVKGGGGGGHSSGGGGRSSGGFRSGGGSKSGSGSGSSSKGFTWGSKSKPSAPTGNKKIDGFWKRNPSGAKPKVHRSGHGHSIIILNGDGSQETYDCD